MREILRRALGWAAHGGRRWYLLSGFGLAIALILIARFGTDAGVSYDEPAQRAYGDMIVAWFRSGFTDARATLFWDLYLYGGLFDAPAQWIASHVPLDGYDTRHLLSALCALLGVVGAFRLAAAVGGPRAGLLAAVVLALTPCWIGHGLFNPKDIPFGAAATFASLAALRVAIGPAPVRLRDAGWAGLAAGIALGVRPGGVFVLGYPCLAVVLRLALELYRRRRHAEAVELGALIGNLAACLALCLAITWLVMLAAWPWAQLHPLTRPFEAMRIARNFAWSARVLFEGRMIPADKLPLRYLPVWFAITLPETYFVAVLTALGMVIYAAIGRCKRRGMLAGPVAQRALREHAAAFLDRIAGGELLRPVIGGVMLATFIGVPLDAIFITRPVLYDAQRHALFLLPPMAAAAGWTLSEAFSAGRLPRGFRGACAAALIGIALSVCVDIVQLHPYEYVYFNRLSGGLAGQYRKFETDYWSISYREGLEWVLKELAPPDARRRLRVASCDIAGDDRLRYYLTQWNATDKMRVVDRYDRADVYLAVRRFNCHRVPGEILHVVRRQGIPLLYVRRTQK